MSNKNDSAFLDDIKTKIFQHLGSLDGAPSVQMHEVPPDLFDHEIREAKMQEAQDPDVRTKECQVSWCYLSARPTDRPTDLPSTHQTQDNSTSSLCVLLLLCASDAVVLVVLSLTLFLVLLFLLFGDVWFSATM
jgi:hypothetical protein